MNLIAKAHLLPQIASHVEALDETFKRVNAACNFMAEIVLEHNLTSQTQIHHATYKLVREQFDLGAQMTLRCTSQVYDRAQKGRLHPQGFEPTDPISYDERILTWILNEHEVTLWTVHGRKTIPFECGPHQYDLLRFQRGTSDLIFFEEDFYIFSMCDVPSPSPKDIEGFRE